ncbi:MAG: winged helix-turn-helix transcriptional regulator [Deltaproteobacteria bacterium]|nr:winged helix-turn-helix transcriptional regulator [Deltaproteobacteria bacterium]
MNTNRSPSSQDHFRSLQILDELAKNDNVTQRDLSNRLGIALGLVNSYVKNLVAKGYITVKAIPPKRYGYYLTPKGFVEKTRLACDLLQDYTRIYREAKSNYRTIFHTLENAGATRIIFAGVDEVAEFAFITMRETGLHLVGMADTERVGEKFFEFVIRPLPAIRTLPYDRILVTSYSRRKQLFELLLASGVREEKIVMSFPL